MKRKDLIRHLERRGCEFLRDGSNHTVYVNRRANKVYVNRRANKVTTVPRHREVDEYLSRKICKDLGISKAELG